MVIKLIMLSVRLTCPLLIISLFVSVFSLPVLNSKDQEISWQAWLLIDEQNQNRQMEPRRRITAKSVFDVPARELSAERLKPCDEGFTTDETGKCIKIIKIDEDQQLEFLLNEMQFDLDVLDPSNSEPLHFNIPLDDAAGDAADYSTDKPEEQTNVALILTPIAKDMKQSDEETKVVKKDEKSNEMASEQELKELIKAIKSHEYDTTSFIPLEDEIETTTFSMLQDNDDDNHDGNMESTIDFTTLAVPTTTEDAEKLTEVTTMKTYREEDDSTTVPTTTTKIIDTTTLLSRIPTTMDDEQTTVPTTTATTSTADKLTIVTTNMPKITTYHPKVTTYHPYFDKNSRANNPIKFPNINDDRKSHIQQQSYHHDDRSYIKFPDVDTPYQHESEFHRSRDGAHHFGNYFNEIVTPEPSERVRQMLLAPKGVTKSYYQSFIPSEPYLLPKPTYGIHQFRKTIHNNFKFPKRELLTTNQEHYGDYKQYGATTESHLYGKRNRDRQGNIFLIPSPPRWTEQNHRRPLVIRSLPMEDVSVLFGYNNKHGQSVNR